ncbi:cardiolipin synthase B [Roseomonas sp. KE2513]|uniref:phospholipase D-like domain-containing protein n=1 Tax=Roseomonas sp. KE2513 TaxID=2479202 RepID=UPI0018DF6F02|nr:phospholipase D-like domain-containing protein [Roseomonas sp. KE2513]MBI0537874.1 cardiolipin synthase B [Roseomonas sp. KE2513]
MRHFLPILALLGPGLLGGCASAPTPGVSRDLLAARASAGPGGSIDLIRRQGERFSGLPFLDGNRVELLVDGPATFGALTEAIHGARTRIDMESYEFDEEAGGRFADMLLAARARGVEVNLVYDAWGAAETSKALFNRLRTGGVRVVEFNPLGPNDRVPVALNKRDHRKLLLVDGRLAITGGVNISRVYQNAPRPEGADPEDQAWRDTDVRIEGPVVAQFARYFMETWRQQNGPPIADHPPTPRTPVGNMTVQAIDGAPDNDQPLIYRTLLSAIELADRSIHLTTGFFVPTPDLARALAAAARRGVDVQIVVPGQSDSSAAIAAGRAKYGDLLEAGVRIHERQGRVLHAKTAVVDGAWSAVGSSNLDWRSTVWNNEIDAIILGPEFGGRMETLFRHDVAASREITLEAWRARGLGERLREVGASLVETFL